jgi:cell division protein FtsQ
MSASHVRRGGGTRANARKSPPKVTVPKKLARKLPVSHARANRMLGLAFGGFMLALGLFVAIALDLPAKAKRSAGAAIGRAGFTVSGYQIVGLKHMDRAPIDDVVTDELHRAADQAGAVKAPQPLVDVARIRERLLQFGWVKDARISHRLPDTLVVDIVERTPAALWQDSGRLALIDADGVVLDRVPIDQMPDLPLLIGPGANSQARELGGLMTDVPTLKPQLASATWVGRRRWDLSFQSGETVALPEGDDAARTALLHFAEGDKEGGLLGRGFVRFDLRNWARDRKMTVQLPKGSAAPATDGHGEG